jgi:RimJ/RimL family protein N-acetyltransferase
MTGASPRERLPPWHERLTLSNGRQVLIRPIRPEDAEPLRAGFGLLEPDEIRQRFLHSVKELSAETAERLTHVNPRTEFALVVAEPLPPGEALIGAVARVAIDDNGRDAEFAILVSRYIKQMGLGRYLMTRLVKWAKGKKLNCLYGDVLENNAPMLTLAQSLGFHREFRQESPGLVRVRLELKPRTPSRIPSDQWTAVQPQQGR